MQSFLKSFLTAILLVSVLAAPALGQTLQMRFQSNENIKNGLKAFNKGNLDKAIYYYDRALRRSKLTPSDRIAAYNGLCASFMYKGEYDQAISNCEHSLAIKANNWETLNNLGISYLGLKEYQTAINYLEEGLELNGDSEILKANLNLVERSWQEEQIRKELMESKETAETDKDGQEKSEQASDPDS